MKQKQSKEEQETIDLGLSAVVIGNQSIAADAATKRFKCLKSLSSMTLGLTLGLFIGCIAGVWYIYNHSPGSLPGLPDSFGETSYNDLMEINADQSNTIRANKIVIRGHKARHLMLIAMTEDDCVYLKKPLEFLGGQTCWDFYRENTTSIRMKGFLSIVHDGNHPNLAAWYSQIQDGLTEVEQLQLRNKELLEILTDEQRDRLDCPLKTFKDSAFPNRPLQSPQ